jgi:hypothetical protein
VLRRRFFSCSDNRYLRGERACGYYVTSTLVRITRRERTGVHGDYNPLSGSQPVIVLVPHEFAVFLPSEILAVQHFAFRVCGLQIDFRVEGATERGSNAA